MPGQTAWWTARIGRVKRLLRQAACLSLLGLTAVVATLVATPAWAPEDPWRLAAQVPLVRAPGAATSKLLLSVILSESRFRVDAVSEKGAIGLMQLLPSTAEGLAAQLDLEWGGDARLLDPRLNIALGTYYLKQLMITFDDDVNLALTAYNKGPGYVLKMQASGVMETTAANFPSSYAERIVTRLDTRTRRAL